MSNHYPDLSAVLARLDVPLVVSEVHGLCCGLLCSLSSAAAKTRWFTETLEAASLSPEAVSQNAADIKLLDDWFGQTLSELNGSDIDFNPLLPDEDVPVNERFMALKDFCAGFTYGIGIAMSQQGHSALPADTREIIEDFQSIEAAEDMGAGEASFQLTNKVDRARPSLNGYEEIHNELLEYVRVGVLLILEELRPVNPVVQEKLS